MTELMQKLLAKMVLAKDGATEESLAAAAGGTPVANTRGGSLPPDLRDFLEERDGGKGVVGDRSRPLILWSAAEIAREAEAQEVSLQTPGLVLFGTDGGAEGYGYLPRLKAGRYGRISLLAAGAHEFDSLGDSFTALLQALAAGR
jgi:hypothetical protein